MKDDLGACYALGNDVNASGTQTWNGGAGFEPVGDGTDAFTGKFDGRMFTITWLYINRPNTDLVGLFGYVTDGGMVQRVGLAEVDITGRRNSGPLVGCSSGATVCYCWSSGSIRGSHDYQMRLGGLIGISSGANSYVYQCFSSVNVTATGGAHQVGGLAGYNGHGSIMSDCYATGDVSGHWKVGGLVGDNPYPEGGYITRCYSIGKVTGAGGGLVGFNYKGGMTYDSYWDIETSGRTSSYGGTGKTTAAMKQQGTFVGWDFVDVWGIVENETYPFLLAFVTPVVEVAVDIKPGSCPNPLNLAGNGVLPVAILGTEDFDADMIDPVSVRLAGVGSIRSSLEDVAAPAAGSDECDCGISGPDGHGDLTLKFKTQQLVGQIVNVLGEPVEDEQLVLSLEGRLFDGTIIRGEDCIIVRGKAPRSTVAKRSDINEDGIVNIVDFGRIAENWLEPTL
jgi:hypothetical protein